MMKITCDYCKAEIHLQPETLRDGEIEHSFFRCPECGAVFLFAVTDTTLRDSLAEYERRWRVNKAKRQSEQFLRELEELKQKNMKRTQELMEQYPLAPLLQSIVAE